MPPLGSPLVFSALCGCLLGQDFLSELFILLGWIFIFWSYCKAPKSSLPPLMNVVSEYWISEVSSGMIGRPANNLVARFSGGPSSCSAVDMLNPIMTVALEALFWSMDSPKRPVSNLSGAQPPAELKKVAGVVDCLFVASERIIKSYGFFLGPGLGFSVSTPV